ncbi:MAG: type I methionyl aminopeptidase [Robiginitomaculum sp.]|nr:type I methionyl aminopeptidase [Robiginitomaculum sp.]
MYSQADDTPAQRSNTIKLHDEASFAGMRAAGKLAAECLDMLTPHMVPGAVTDDLDKMAREFILDHGALPACLFYRGYTRTLCISTNHVVCHGIPSAKTLKTGDIANVDVTVIVDGWHGDTSRMFAIGDVKRNAQRLIDVTYEALMLGIAEVKPSATLGDIGAVIQEYAEMNRCSIVRDFCGHGLGRVFHDAPNVLHYGDKGEGTELREGMFFTIEPMLNLGKPSVKILSDGWTAVTRDKSLSAQFEHSIGVTATGAEIFTLSPAGLHNPTA